MRNVSFIFYFFAKSAFAVPLAISNVSALNFGVMTPSDPPATIPAGTVENAQNASFLVTGDPNVTYTIMLPAGTVNLTTGGGSMTETIVLSSFTSFPVSSGLLNGVGQQMLFLGATRAAILMNQVPGSYSGNIPITVLY